MSSTSGGPKPLEGTSLGCVLIIDDEELTNPQATRISRELSDFFQNVYVFASGEYRLVDPEDFMRKIAKILNPEVR